MKRLAASLLLAAATTVAAETQNFAGEYADKSFLKGQAVFQLSLEQSGNAVTVFFSAAHNDGSGAAPEADGHGTATAKGTVEFNWQDSFKNAGTGTISRVGEGVAVSIKATRVTDSRCLEFYNQNIRLRRVGKK